MEVIRKLTSSGAKASSNPSDTETTTDNIINKAFTNNALPTFEDIAFTFIVRESRKIYQNIKPLMSNYELFSR